MTGDTIREHERAMDRLAVSLDNARSPLELFLPGIGRGRPSEERESRRRIEARFRELAGRVHPDQLASAPAPLRARADALLRRLVRSRDEAVAALRVSVPPARLHWSSALTDYALSPTPAERGDHADLYLGESLAGLPVLAKVARSSAANRVLERELEWLTETRESAAGRDFAPFLPEPVDTFEVRRADGAHRVLIYDHDDDSISVAELRRRFPAGVPAPDAAWIARRGLGQAVVAEALEVFHGAIVPEHVLVGCTSHDPLHLGWSLAGPDARARVAHGREAWSAPELRIGDRMTASAELFMVGQTILELLGGDPTRGTLPPGLPEPFAREIAALIAPRPGARPRSALDALDSLTRTVRELWGKSYRQLVLPT